LINSTATCGTCYPTCATCSGAGTDAANACTGCITNSTASGTQCNCNSGYVFSKTSNTCVVGTVTASGAYLFTGILTLIVLLLALI
jgi:hypothetical protein